MTSPLLMESAKPGLVSNFDRIPIINLSHVTKPHPDWDDRRNVAKEIRSACVDVGFFYVSNHGIPEEIIHEAWDAAKDFFALPLNFKLEVDYRKSKKYRGYYGNLYTDQDSDHPEGMQEVFGCGWEPLDDSQKVFSQERPIVTSSSIWPAHNPNFRVKVQKYYNAALALGRLLFSLFALALDLPETFFDDKMDNASTYMALLHYFPRTNPTGDRVISFDPHTDWQFFTILWQQPEIQALQVRNLQGQWIDVPPVPGTLVINLGDMFARWTNDVFQSTVHRVAKPNGVDRYAIALFSSTAHNVKIEPIPGCTSGDRPYKYQVITAGEYLKLREEEDLKSRNQISG